MRRDLGLSIVYMRHYFPYPDIPISIPISDGQTRETRRILPKRIPKHDYPIRQGLLWVEPLFSAFAGKRGEIAGTPGLEWANQQIVYEAFWRTRLPYLLAPGP